MATPTPPDSSQPTGLEGIAEAAAAAGERAKVVPVIQRVADLEAKLAQIEPLLEQMQANSNIGPKLNEYIGDLRSEQIFFNRARYVVGCFSILTLAGFLLLLGLAVFHARSPLLTAPPIAIATFVIGMVSGIVYLLSGFIKGVFRSTAERHADGFLPPALEKAAEFLNKVVGGPK